MNILYTDYTFTTNDPEIGRMTSRTYHFDGVFAPMIKMMTEIAGLTYDEKRSICQLLEQFSKARLG